MSSHGTFQFEVWTFLEVLTVQEEKQQQQKKPHSYSPSKFSKISSGLHQKRNAKVRQTIEKHRDKQKEDEKEG